MRADLLALTPDALAALTNRGLVKRAVKTLEEGAGPTVSEDGDGAVRGAHPDGTVTVLPAGGLEAATCSCGAGGVCRHVLALVLAYQTHSQASCSVADCQDTAPPDFDDWSPAEFTDAELEALVGARALASARKMYAAGYAARLSWASPTAPAPAAELPTCTVRFLVPHDLGYARSDAAANGPESVALAVWAFQSADGPDPVGGDGHIQVGGRTGAELGDGFGPALELATDVLLTGAAHLGTGMAPRLAVASRALDAAGLRWPLLAVEELAGLLAAYEDRSTRYLPGHLAELLAELHARHRAAAFAGGSARSRILGTEEAAETQLRRARLTGLGCRVEGAGDERRVEIYFADSGSGNVLTIRHAWPADGADLAPRRVGGSTVAALAAGTVVTETALRGADRRLRFGVNRIARTTVSPSSGNWHTIPPELFVTDLDALAAELDRLPPRLIRPRVAAEDVRVIEIGEVAGIGYRAGSQRLEAALTATHGGTAALVAEHKSAAPAALDVLAETLAGGRGALRYLSGTVRRGRGGIVITPIALVADTAVVIPDLATGDGSTALAGGTNGPTDATVAAIDSALALLAEMAHQGIRHLPPTFGARLDAGIAALAATGLARGAEDLRAVRRSLGPAPGAEAVTAWADAAVRLMTLAEAV